MKRKARKNQEIEQPSIETRLGEALTVAETKRRQRQQIGEQVGRILDSPVVLKAGAQVGLKSAGKVGSKYVPVVGQVLGAFEAAPIVYRGTKKMIGGQIDSAKKTIGHVRKGEFKEAAKQHVRGGLTGLTDYATTSLKGGAAFFTSKEVADLIPERKNPMRSYVRTHLPARANPGMSDVGSYLSELLGGMIALRTAYQHAHWYSIGYANHLLFERLYQSLDEDIDTLAELSAQARKFDELPLTRLPQDFLVAASDRLIALNSEGVSLDALEDQEDLIIRRAVTLLDLFAQQHHYGLENFLQGLVQNRQRAMYLLSLAESN